MDLRGADLRRVRQEALENLERHDISTTLVVTVKRGVNDDEIGEIVRHALRMALRARHHLPAGAGRRPQRELRQERERIVLSDIRRRIVEDSGVFGEDDMVPLPCNPEAISIGYGLRNGTSVLPVTSLMPREEFVAIDAQHHQFEKQPVLREKFIELFSLSSGANNAPERLARIPLLPAQGRRRRRASPTRTCSASRSCSSWTASISASAASSAPASIS